MPYPQGRPAPLEDRVVILTDSYRSEKSITSIASRINEQDETVVRRDPGARPARGPARKAGSGSSSPARPARTYRGVLHGVLAAWAGRYYESAAPSGASYRDIGLRSGGGPAGGCGRTALLCTLSSPGSTRPGYSPPSGRARPGRRELIATSSAGSAGRSTRRARKASSRAPPSSSPGTITTARFLTGTSASS